MTMTGGRVMDVRWHIKLAMFNRRWNLTREESMAEAIECFGLSFDDICRVISGERSLQGE